MQSLSTSRRACSTFSRRASQPAVNHSCSALRNTSSSRRTTNLRVISVDTDIFPTEVLQVGCVPPGQTSPSREELNTCHFDMRVPKRNPRPLPSSRLQSDQIVLVDFWASWCGPCKLVAPLMTWAEKEYSGQIKVVKVEHDKNPELIAKYKVYGLPTLLLFKNGVEMQGSKREGAVNKVMLTEYLKSNGAIA